MTNAVDVLVVGGPANGRQVCLNRENGLPTYIDFPVEGEGEVTYTRREWQHPISGKLYHIATRDEDAVTDQQVIVQILFGNFEPAWDLNR